MIEENDRLQLCVGPPKRNRVFKETTVLPTIGAHEGERAYGVQEYLPLPSVYAVRHTLI